MSDQNTNEWLKTTSKEYENGQEILNKYQYLYDIIKAKLEILFKEELDKQYKK